MVKSAEDIRIEKMIEEGATRIAGNMIAELKRQLSVEDDPEEATDDNMSHVMTVKQLRDALNKYPDGTHIILQKDGEGNGYSPLSDISEGIYLPDSTYSGEVIDLSWSAEDADMEEDEWATMKVEHPLSLIFNPVN